MVSMNCDVTSRFVRRRDRLGAVASRSPSRPDRRGSFALEGETMPGNKLEKITIPKPRKDSLKVHCKGTMFSGATALAVMAKKGAGSLDVLIETTTPLTPGSSSDEVIATFPRKDFRNAIRPHLKKRPRGHHPPQGVRSLAAAADDEVVTAVDDTTIYVDVDNRDAEKIVTHPDDLAPVPEDVIDQETLDWILADEGG